MFWLRICSTHMFIEILLTEFGQNRKRSGSIWVFSSAPTSSLTENSANYLPTLALPGFFHSVSEIYLLFLSLSFSLSASSRSLSLFLCLSRFVWLSFPLCATSHCIFKGSLTFLCRWYLLLLLLLLSLSLLLPSLLLKFVLLPSVRLIKSLALTLFHWQGNRPSHNQSQSQPPKNSYAVPKEPKIAKSQSQSYTINAILGLFLHWMLSQKKVERKQERKVELDRRRAYALKKYALIDNHNIYLLLFNLRWRNKVVGAW